MKHTKKQIGMKSTPSALRSVSRLALTLLAFALAGCGHKDAIVGKWQITQPGLSGNTTIEFTPDGKETITGQGSSEGMPVNGAVNGTYTVSGTNLTQNWTTMTINGRSIPIPASLTRTGPFTLNGDHLTMIDPSSKQRITLTRMKG